jgi:hypothetical protein
MVITAYGFVLFLNSAQATVLQAGYPPYGLANVSFVELAFFLILTGLFNSTVSVAQDVKLRRSIKSSALLPSSKLLDNIGTAQLTKEIEDKVMKMTEDDAYALTQQSGVAPYIIDNELKSYLDKVVEQLVKKKRM